MSGRFLTPRHKLADIEGAFEAYTPRDADGKHAKTVLFNVSSGDSTEAIKSDDAEVSSLSGMLEKFNPASPHGHSVLCKPGSKKCILVDEVDEECASSKDIPRRFSRGRSGAGSIETKGGEQEHRARTRSISRFRGYGKEEEDKIIRRARARSVSRGIPISWNLMTNEEYSELSSTELAKRICPQSFHRFRRVGPNDKENDSWNENKEAIANDAHITSKHKNWDAWGRMSKSDFDVKFMSEIHRVETFNLDDAESERLDLDETENDGERGVSKSIRNQRKSNSVLL